MLRRARAMTLIELMVVVALVALLAAVAVPGLRRARISASEAGAIALLHRIAAAQEAFRQDVRADQDGDGLGEYGYLRELTGEVAPRGGTPDRPRRAYLDASLSFVGGVAYADGYCVLVYLPTPDEPAPETEAPPARRDAADLQEQRFVAYAWPVERGTTGNRAYVIDQRGQLFASTNRQARYSGAARRPAATAAFDLGGASPITLDAPLGGRGPGVGDQQVWEEFR